MLLLPPATLLHIVALQPRCLRGPLSIDSALTFRMLQPLQVAQCCKYLDKDEGDARAEPKASLKHVFLGRESTQSQSM